MPAGPAGSARPTAGATADQLMSYMDANGDGKITIAEAPEHFKRSFAFIDRNADGGIDVKEPQVMADYNNRQSQSPSGGAGQTTAGQVMAWMDTNRDRKITMDEAPGELQTWFTQVDQNADGGIDVKEAQVIANGMNNQ